jgi:hypothetical protein
MKAAFNPIGIFPAISRSPVQTAGPAMGMPLRPMPKDTVTFSGIRGRSLIMRQESEALLNRYKGQAFQVSFNAWAVASNDIPLATTGLETCRALAIIDRDQHFLAHVLDNATPEEIQAAVESACKTHKLDMENSDIAIIRGSQDNEEVEDNIREALRNIAPDRENDIQLYHRERESEDPVGVALAYGQVHLYRSPKDGNYDVQEHLISP